MNYELKFFFIKLIVLIIITPLLGFLFLCYFEYFEKVWKSNNRRNKWWMMCTLIFILIVIGGWLQ